MHLSLSIIRQSLKRLSKLKSLSAGDGLCSFRFRHKVRSVRSFRLCAGKLRRHCQIRPPEKRKSHVRAFPSAKEAFYVHRFNRKLLRTNDLSFFLFFIIVRVVFQFVEVIFSRFFRIVLLEPGLVLSWAVLQLVHDDFNRGKQIDPFSSALKTVLPSGTVTSSIWKFSLLKVAYTSVSGQYRSNENFFLSASLSPSETCMFFPVDGKFHNPSPSEQTVCPAGGPMSVFSIIAYEWTRFHTLPATE